MMRRLRCFLALPRSEQRLLLLAFGAVAVARLATAVLPLRRLIVWRPTRPSGRSAPVGQTPSPELIARCVVVTSGFIPGATCLVQALAAQSLLSWHGYNATLRIGVATDEQGRLEAHAWIEREESILLGGPPGLIAHYRALRGRGAAALNKEHR